MLQERKFQHICEQAVPNLELNGKWNTSAALFKSKTPSGDWLRSWMNFLVTGQGFNVAVHTICGFSNTKTTGNVRTKSNEARDIKDWLAISDLLSSLPEETMIISTERKTSSNSLGSTNSYAALCWARDLDRHRHLRLWHSSSTPT